MEGRKRLLICCGMAFSSGVPIGSGLVARFSFGSGRHRMTRSPAAVYPPLAPSFGKGLGEGRRVGSGVVRLLDLSEGVPLQPNLLLMEKELWGRTSVWLPLLRGCRILLRWGRIPTTSGLLECLHRV